MNTSIKAVLTGHTKGLGAGLALRLLSQNIPVLALARSSSASLRQQFPSLCRQAELNLADTLALSAWLGTSELHDFLADCGTVLLINNAGMVQPVGALSRQDPLEVAAAVALNVTAPLMLAAAVVAATPGKQRRVLHISSGAASSAYPGWSVYCATKAALDHHARAVALDAEEGVRICSLAPGVIDTGMQAVIRATPEDRFPLRQRFVDMKQEGQLVAPDDCAARMIDYLLSDKFGDKAVDDLRHYG
jgi:benzil reductase ((S)-benzoin forming)